MSSLAAKTAVVTGASLGSGVSSARAPMRVAGGARHAADRGRADVIVVDARAQSGGARIVRGS